MDISLIVESSSREMKETWILSLFTRCPFSNDVNCNNPSNCQINEIRYKMNFSQYADFIKSRIDLEIEDIIMNHLKCVNNK